MPLQPQIQNFIDEESVFFAKNLVKEKSAETVSRIITKAFPDSNKTNDYRFLKQDRFQNILHDLSKNALDGSELIGDDYPAPANYIQSIIDVCNDFAQKEAQYRKVKAYNKIEKSEIVVGSETFGEDIRRVFDEGGFYFTYEDLAERYNQDIKYLIDTEEDKVVDDIKRKVVADIEKARKKNEVVEDTIKELKSIKERKLEEENVGEDGGDDDSVPSKEPTEIDDEEEKSDDNSDSSPDNESSDDVDLDDEVDGDEDDNIDDLESDEKEEDGDKSEKENSRNEAKTKKDSTEDQEESDEDDDHPKKKKKDKSEDETEDEKSEESALPALGKDVTLNDFFSSMEAMRKDALRAQRAKKLYIQAQDAAIEEARMTNQYIKLAHSLIPFSPRGLENLTINDDFRYQLMKCMLKTGRQLDRNLTNTIEALGDLIKHENSEKLTQKYEQLKDLYSHAFEDTNIIDEEFYNLGIGSYGPNRSDETHLTLYRNIIRKVLNKNKISRRYNASVTVEDILSNAVDLYQLRRESYRLNEPLLREEIISREEELLSKYRDFDPDIKSIVSSLLTLSKSVDIDQLITSGTFIKTYNNMLLSEVKNSSIVNVETDIVDVIHNRYAAQNKTLSESDREIIRKVARGESTAYSIDPTLYEKFSIQLASKENGEIHYHLIDREARFYTTLVYAFEGLGLTTLKDRGKLESELMVS